MSEEELINSTERLLDKLLELYRPEQIVLNCFYGAERYITKQGTLKKFAPVAIDFFKKWNSFSDKLKLLCVKKLHTCHIINPPDNLIADASHHFCLHPLHYHKLYYEYAAKAMNVILQSYTSNEEEFRLAALKELYSEKFATLRTEVESYNIRLEKDKWQICAASFSTLILNNSLTFDEEMTFQLQNLFLTKSYKHIAIYGDTEITKVLLHILKNTDIVVDYIVENASKPVPGVKTKNRNPADYPDCDIMLIADIASYGDIKTKLEKLKVPFPFVNAAEFIKSLPAAAGDGIDKIKAKIQSLEEELSASKIKQAKLSSEVEELQQTNKTASESITALTAQCEISASEKMAVTLARDKAIAERNEVTAELQSVKNSLSFKLGRVATFIPRKIRDAYKRKK